MAIYKQIQDDVRSIHKVVVKSCWIAHVKELNGLQLRQAPNRISFSHRKYPCPEQFRPLIEQSMIKFGILPKLYGA